MKLNIKTGLITQLPDLNVGRLNFGLCNVCNYLYAIGGYNSRRRGNITVKDLERFNVMGNDDEWKILDQRYPDNYGLGLAVVVV